MNTQKAYIRNYIGLVGLKWTMYTFIVKSSCVDDEHTR